MAIRYKVEQAKIGFGTEKKEAYVGKIQLGMTVETEMPKSLAISLIVIDFIACFYFVLQNALCCVQHLEK